MPDPTDNDVGYTPDFITPNQVASQRAYAKALLKQSLAGAPVGKSGDVQAVSPWGVGAGLTQALLGGYGMNRAGQLERQSMVNAAGDTSALTPPGMNQAQYSINPSGGPQSLNYANVTAGQESANPAHPQGNYSAIGPRTSDGDYAYGKYQVKGSNIPQWTQEVLGKAMTPQQFLNDSHAQDAVYNAKFGQYVQQYGPEGAARAWYGGPQNVNNPNARDLAHPNAPTVGQYGQNFAHALPFSGEPSNTNAPANDAQSAITTALQRPSSQPSIPGMGTSTATNPGGGNTDQPPIQPGLVPQRQQVSRQQLMAIMANPYVDPAVKKYATESYFSQAQPLQLQGPYGSNVIINPRNPGQQQVIPGAGEYKETQVGDIKVPQYNYIVPPGYHGAPPQMGTIYPGGGAPQVPPPQAPQAPPAPPQQPPQGGGALPFAEPETPPGAAPPQSAPGGPLAANPPALPSQGGPLGAAPPKGPQVAQTAMPGVLPPWMQQAVDWNREQKVKTEGQTQAAQKAAESSQKFYDDTTTQSLSAANEGQELKVMSDVVNSPNFYSGFGSGAVMELRRAIAAVTGDTTAAAPMEVANKMRNDINLQSLKTKLGGLGQIRLAEVKMVDNAFANLDNSVAANRALLYMAQKVNTRQQEAGNLAFQYTRQHGGVPDLGLKNYLFDYYKNKPLLTDDEIKEFSDKIGAEAKAPAGAAQPSQGGVALPPGFKPAPKMPSGPPPVDIPL